MRKVCVLSLVASIVVLSAATSEATIHAKSNNGSEISWATNYPKATKQNGLNPPVLYVKFVVTPAPGWTPMRIVYTVKRWANADGTGYDGEFSGNIISNFSEEKTHIINESGKSVTVVEIYLTVQKMDQTESATESDSAPVVIRD